MRPKLVERIESSRHLLGDKELSNAETQTETLLGIEPPSAEAHVLAATIQITHGDLSRAIRFLHRALEIDSEYLDALLLLAILMQNARDDEGAVRLLQRALALQDDDVEVVNLLGVCLLRLGRASEARDAFYRLKELAPSSGEAHANLGMALRLMNRGEEALAAFRDAVRFAPERPANYLQLFKQYQQLSRWQEGIEVLQAGLVRHPKSAQLAEALAAAYGRLNMPDEAEENFRRVYLASASASATYAGWLQDAGRFEDSIRVLKQSLALHGETGLAYHGLADAKCFEQHGVPLTVGALKLIEDSSVQGPDRMHLCYALGKTYQHLNDAKSAMFWFDQANELAYRIYPACLTFNARSLNDEFNKTAHTYKKEFIETRRSLGSECARPIFIVGMIRSGTTLLDRIVSSHPQVTSVGEQPFWNAEADAIHARWTTNPPDQAEVESLAQRYIRAVSEFDRGGRFTDKMPLNFRHLGLIHIAFPEARILHIGRDPFDTCLSIYTNFFGGGPNFTYRQENIVEFFRVYRRYMAHWRENLPAGCMLEIEYESLVADPATTIREVLNFLELPWDDACLHQERNSGQVPTPSRWQARQPIYGSSVGKRAEYGPYSGALAAGQCFEENVRS